MPTKPLTKREKDALAFIAHRDRFGLFAMSSRVIRRDAFEKLVTRGLAVRYGKLVTRGLSVRDGTAYGITDAGRDEQKRIDARDKAASKQLHGGDASR